MMRTQGTRSFPAAVSLLLAAPTALLWMAGCASTPPPVADLSQAHTLVAQAEQSDAPRYDGADLASAQDKMQRADQDARQQPATAARLAQEASVDAELALARTRANKEQDALNQVNDSLSALRQEVREEPAAPPGPDVAAPQAAPPTSAAPDSTAPATEPPGGPQP
ncbi:MAG TPA: DUF4398 domain-containing protein [Steroidobacteraceae bacterium]|jgi:hypothetical protein|nr:DUF4398 domain-containing protein [Steroidobacteraceae bacterium]